MNQTILITGITSIHGWPIWQRFRAVYGEAVRGVCPAKMRHYFDGDAGVYPCDIEDADTLARVFHEVEPHAVIHAGGVCDLDMCEDNPDFAYEVNVQGARNIAHCAGEHYVIYISSDLVFSGGDPPAKGYREIDMPDPVSVVGKTYVAAEEEIKKLPHHAIVRIGLPIGQSITGTKGAVDFIAGRLSAGRPMTLFHDEVRSLITTDDVAEGARLFYEARGKGLFHYAGPQSASLHDIGQFLVDSREYAPECLIKSSRFDEVNGPPRIGNVTLNSSRFYQLTDFVPATCFKIQGPVSSC